MFLLAQATLGASNSLILQEGRIKGEEEKLAFLSSKSTFGTFITTAEVFGILLNHLESSGIFWNPLVF